MWFFDINQYFKHQPPYNLTNYTLNGHTFAGIAKSEMFLFEIKKRTGRKND